MYSIAWWPTIIVLLIATISDLRSRRIPNWLVFPFLAAGPVVSAFTGGWHGLGQSLLGILLAVIWMGAMYCLGGMGMGDVKLCAAIGAWIGPGQLFVALVAMAMAGGVMAVVWSLCGGYLKESLRGAFNLLFGLGRRSLRSDETRAVARVKGRKMPYAPAIAVGTVFSFLAMTGPVRSSAVSPVVGHISPNPVVGHISPNPAVRHISSNEDRL